MKKRLEAELISIAHRILKLKNKSELSQLHFETQKLYETLSVLKFVEDNINVVRPKINTEEVEEKLTIAFEGKAIANENEKNELNEIYADLGDNASIVENEIKLQADHNPQENQILDAVIKDEKVVVAEEIKIEFEPLFEIPSEKEEKPIEKKQPKQIFEDLIGSHFNELTFEKVSNQKAEPIAIPVFEPKVPIVVEIEEIEEVEKVEKVEEFEEVTTITQLLDEIAEPVQTPKLGSLNENFAKTITFGLNDRIGFEKNLFAGSSEDMNRVISQLSTYDSLQEAEDFIEEMVKPDYNNWDGKEDYVARFMEIVARKFN